MRLVDIVTGTAITLPNDLLWSDEFNWSPTSGQQEFSLSGAQIIEIGEKQSGRPITLAASSDEMAWVTRETVAALRAWLLPGNRQMRLELQYPTDTRTFKVIFRHWETPIEASPVRQFPGHELGDWFKISIRLTEIV